MSHEPEPVVLFEDDFASYPLTERMDADFFRRLYDQQGEPARPASSTTLIVGPWQLRTSHYAWHSHRIKGWLDCRLPWRLIDRDGQRWLEQPESFFNVVLTAGDADWDDYTLELDAAVADGPAGPLVRYRTSRQNYWVKLEAGQTPELIRRDQEDHFLLARAAGPILEPDRVYRVRIDVDGSRITVALDNATVLAADDNAYAHGSIALRTEGPARFTAVRVTTPAAAAAALEARAARHTARVTTRRATCPGPKLLHEVPLPEGTTVTHLRDVNDDGRLEIVACEVAVPQLDYIRLTKLRVLDWEGRELWSFGESMAGQFAVHGAFAFNTADIDGDGRTEVLITRDFEFLILDGATGEVKRRGPTPTTFKGQEDVYDRTVGDSILVCNLRGLDSPRDIVLKDRYRNIWAFTDELEPLWHRHLNTGHYPRAADIDGDGRDEIMGGYSLLNPDGHTRWVVPGTDPYYSRFPGPDHLDSVLIGRFGPEPDSPIRIAMGASDFGFLLLDVEGRILARHVVGHSQSLGAGRFRPDLPGRQFVILTAWGNQGILNLFDCEGNLLLIREVGSASVQPVNWLGDGSMLLTVDGHLADGSFEPLVKLPGGASVSPCAHDVNDDGVDELIVQKGRLVQIYGPEDVPSDPVRFPKPDLTNWNGYGGFCR